jgi:site-specific DNA-methyltransferase (adenine-specific)
MDERNDYNSIPIQHKPIRLDNMNINEIKPNPSNPRIIKDDKFKKLVKSIQDFPQMLELRPIVIDENNIVLGGNMRLKACIEAGLTDVPVKQAKELTEEQKKEFIVKDNVGYGEWDWDDLANNWDVEDLTEWGLDIPDFAIKNADASEDDFDVPVGGSETDIVLGDIFEIGQHKLLCGSSTETDNWSKIFGSEYADMVVTDPPYNVNYKGSNGLTIENDNMGDGEFYQFLYDFYTALGSYTKAGGSWYVWHADLEGHNFRKAFKDSGFKLSSTLIWKKNALVMGRSDYHWMHEPCLYGWKEGASHSWYSDRKQSTILEYSKPSKNAEHPTMKPVELIAYQITNSSKTGDLVADGFLGSGTTMVAAHQLGRKCYGTELDTKYCQVIIDRMKKLDPTLIIKKNGVTL